MKSIKICFLSVTIDIKITIQLVTDSHITTSLCIATAEEAD